MTAVVTEFEELREGHGYLIEAGHLHFGLIAASLPWRTARRHKHVMAQTGHLAGSVAVVRDHGSGRVAIDGDGEAVIRWPADDPVDRELLWRGVADMVRLHAAAGAREVYDYALPTPVWTCGADIERAVRRVREVPVGRGGRIPFCAHQMGSARMGRDPATSVADPQGQLHDTPGVWIGDTSAFPTAVGANPMWTCMALARRTARAILAAR
jgi:choline dehydrogenase-like flavoprotein